jgi:hypothetical protein
MNQYHYLMIVQWDSRNNIFVSKGVNWWAFSQKKPTNSHLCLVSLLTLDLSQQLSTR